MNMTRSKALTSFILASAATLVLCQEPTPQPTRRPFTIIYRRKPTRAPTSSPTAQPTTPRPTRKPYTTIYRVEPPTREPTKLSTSVPTRKPVEGASASPSSQASELPSEFPTMVPTSQPTAGPTRPPVKEESASPSNQASDSPSLFPSQEPTSKPTKAPTIAPTREPTKSPVISPSASPSSNPPTYFPSNNEETPVANVLDTEAIAETFGCNAPQDQFPIANIFDTTTNKYTCIKNVAPEDDVGLIFTPSHGRSSIVEGIRVYADDGCSNCDPVQYRLEGRVGSSSPWVVISSGTFPWIEDDAPDRNPPAIAIDSSYGSGDASLSFSEVTIINVTPYKEYKLTLVTRIAALPLFLGEVELVGKLLAESSSSPTPKPTTGGGAPVFQVGLTPAVFDFEDGSLDDFETDGWTINEDGEMVGQNSAMAPELPALEKSDLALTVDTKHGAHLTFRLKSGVANGDKFITYLNDTTIVQLTSQSPVIPIRSNLPPGRTTMTWRYDSIVDSPGTGYVDDITVTPFQVDGFETGDFSYLGWIPGEGWSVDTTGPDTGEFSAHFSGPIPVGEYLALELNFSSTSGGVFSFRTNPDIGMPYDQLLVYLDDSIVVGFPRRTGGYQSFQETAAPGEHTLSFRAWRPPYEPPLPREEDDGIGEIWVDNFRFNPNPPF